VAPTLIFQVCNAAAWFVPTLRIVGTFGILSELPFVLS
jgi:hypothetical protein